MLLSSGGRVFQHCGDVGDQTGPLHHMGSSIHSVDHIDEAVRIGEERWSEKRVRSSGEKEKKKRRAEEGNLT